MKSSLTTRLARTLFFLIAATTAASMFIVEVFVNDVEDTILGLELKADAKYFTEQLQNGSFQPIKTAQLEAVFLPEGEADLVLPEYFWNRSLPFSLEIEIGKTTLLIYGEQLEAPAGKLFLAQDITIMENRESLVQLALVGVAGLMLLIGFFVARTGARYLVRPFKKLTREVLNTAPGSTMPQITTDYRDQEFCDIAEAFNRFLSALEHHIEREKSFVKLASHELRTPLAVMSGALNVLEQRQNLSAADQKPSPVSVGPCKPCATIRMCCLNLPVVKRPKAMPDPSCCRRSFRTLLMIWSRGFRIMPGGSRYTTTAQACESQPIPLWYACCCVTCCRMRCAILMLA